MSRNGTDFDVIVAGGGMIGSSLALALSTTNLSIAVVEDVPRGNTQQPSFDDRTTALSRSTQRTFEALNVWPEIVAAATPISTIHVSDQGRFGFSHISAEEQGVEALGYVVINRVLGAVIDKAIAAAKNVSWLSPMSVTAVNTTDSTARVTLRSGKEKKTLSASLVVGADGARSSVRNYFGITSTTKDYGQRAIICNVAPESAPEGRAFERFTSGGPLALLPLANDRAGVVWAMSAAQADDVVALSDAEFLTALQRAFGYRLGAFSRVGARVSYPLTLSKALRITSRRGVLVGNAAHGLHPAAAQGFNLGIRDIAALCDCIVDAERQLPFEDPGDPAILARYARWRKSDHEKIVDFTDHLVRGFGSEKPLSQVSRNIGMLGFDLIPGLRGLFAKHTMGLAGRLPRLTRGLPLL